MSLLGLAAGARAAPCPQDGLSWAQQANGGVMVGAGGPPGFVTGDRILQANDRIVRDCTELAEALRAAAEHGLAPLLLVDRDGRRIALLAPALPAVPTPGVPATPGEAEKLGPEDARTVLAIVRGVEAALAAVPRPVVAPQLAANRIAEALEEATREARGSPAVQRAVAPLLARVRVIRDLLRYRATAPPRDASDRGRPGALYEFSSDSEVAQWLRQYPVLRQAVLRAPGRAFMGAERSGLWQPDRALDLLVTETRTETTALRSGPIMPPAAR